MPPAEFYVLSAWMDAGIPLPVILRAFGEFKGKPRKLEAMQVPVRKAQAYWMEAMGDVMRKMRQDGRRNASRRRGVRRSASKPDLRLRAVARRTRSSTATRDVRAGRHEGARAMRAIRQ